VIIVGLLLVALVCLAVGLILPSTAWLIASLIASVGAGYVLFRARTLIAGAHAVDGIGGSTGGSTGGTGASAAATAVLDREPAEAETSEPPRRTRAETRAEARAAKAAAAAEAKQAESDAADMSADADSDAVSHSATATLDSPTELLEPVPAHDESGTEVSGGEFLGDLGGNTESADAADAADAAAGEAEPAVAANDGDVWVIDGRPRYHLATCAIIQGQDAEPIPFDQATEDGFMPCSLCEPNVVRATAS
jgi:hypothetical protein